jgi:hypothetical protein
LKSGDSGMIQGEAVFLIYSDFMKLLFIIWCFMLLVFWENEKPVVKLGGTLSFIYGGPYVERPGIYGPLRFTGVVVKNYEFIDLDADEGESSFEFSLDAPVMEAAAPPKLLKVMLLKSLNALGPWPMTDLFLLNP